MKTGYTEPVRSNTSVAMPPIHRAISRGQTWTDASLDLLMHAMPSLPQLGAAMLLLVAYLAATGSDFGVDPSTQAVLQQAQETAAAEVPGYRPF